jgi:hypothetical protein
MPSALKLQISSWDYTGKISWLYYKKVFVNLLELYESLHILYTLLPFFAFVPLPLFAILSLLSSRFALLAAP